MECVSCGVGSWGVVVAVVVGEVGGDGVVRRVRVVESCWEGGVLVGHLVGWLVGWVGGGTKRGVGRGGDEWGWRYLEVWG